MEPFTLAAIAAFLAPYLSKAGEKVAEKTVEIVLDSRKDLANRFKGLFSTEIISLNLSEASQLNEIHERLESQPELREHLTKKISSNRDLLRELVEAFRQMPQPEFAGVTINAKNIGQVINNPTGPISQNNTSS